jgi:hypothetical protein
VAKFSKGDVMRNTKSENEKPVGVFRWDRAVSYEPLSKKTANQMVIDRLADWIPNRRAIAMARPGEPLPKVPVRASRKPAATAVTPSLESTKTSDDKTDKHAPYPRGLSANPNQKLTERYVSAINSITDRKDDTDRKTIAAVHAWAPGGLASVPGLFE